MKKSGNLVASPDFFLRYYSLFSSRDTVKISMATPSALFLPPALNRHKNQIVVALAVVFFIVVPGTLILVYVNSQKAAQQRLEQQAKAFESPEFATKRHIRKISLKRSGENGEETIEITASGKVYQYDAFGNLIKSGLMGFADVQSLFDKLNRNLDSFGQTYFGSGKYTLIIESNKGTVVIEVNEGDGGNDNGNPVDEVIDEIEDIIEETLYPSPTPVPPPTIYNPNATPTPIPSPTIPVATPTPTLAPGQPTPLPAYMLAPTFTCEEVYSGGRPLPVSNTICGYNPN